MPRLFCYAVNDLITTLQAASSTFSLLLAFCQAQLHSTSGLVGHSTDDILLSSWCPYIFCRDLQLVSSL